MNPLAARMAACLGLVVGLVASAGPVQAQGARSNTPEYFYQPTSGGMSLSFEGHQLLSGSTSTSVSGAKTNDIKLSKMGFAFDCSYGFSDEWAFSAKMALDNRTTDITTTAGTLTSYKQTGRSDVTLMLTNISALGAWSLNIGVGAGLSPGKRLDYTATEDGNNLSGGTSIINYLGLSTTVGSGNYFGGKIQYMTRTQGTGNTNGSAAQDYSIDGGNTATVAAFIATDFAPISADLALAYNFIDPIVYTYSASSTVTANAFQSVQIDAGVQYSLAPAVNLRLGYQMLMFGEQARSAQTTVAAYNESTGSFRLRFEF